MKFRGAEVARLRKRAGMTPADLAFLLGVSLSTVYRWEGARAPSIDYPSRRILQVLKLANGTVRGKLADVLRARGSLAALGLLLEPYAKGTR